MSGGSDLGLSIVRAVVEQHGGRVSATNGDMGGARFELRLPAVRDRERDSRRIVRFRGLDGQRGRADADAADVPAQRRKPLNSPDFGWLRAIGRCWHIACTMSGMRELRYAIRQLVSAPGYAVDVAVVHAGPRHGRRHGVLQRALRGRAATAGLPRRPWHREPGQRPPETVGDGDRFARAELVDVRSRQRTFAAIEGTTLGRMTLNGDADGFAERVKVSDVTPEVFGVLGVPAALGRAFSAADVGAGRLAVISDSLWRTRFGAAQDAVGRAVRRTASPSPSSASCRPASPRSPRWRCSGRSTCASRRSAATATCSPSRGSPRRDPGSGPRRPHRVARDLQQAQPAGYPSGKWSLGAESLRTRLFGRLQGPGGPARRRRLGAAHRLRERRDHGAAARRRAAAQLSIRLAVGASRGAIARQLLTEAAVIATLGAVAGTALATFGISALVAYAPAGIRAGRLDLPAALFLSRCSWS